MEKFWIPVVDESVYYNPYNTTVYALLFGLAALYLVYPFSKRIGITFDKDFFKGIAPYAFLGGAVRSLKDINAINSFLLETPFIYIVLFVFTVSSIKFSQFSSERTEYRMEDILTATGLIPLAVSLSFYSISNLAALGLFLSLVLTWSLAGYAVLQLVRPDLLNYSFVVPVAAHFFDASTTVTALRFGGREKHVVGQFFIDVFGPYGMFLMKSLIIIPVVYYICENMEGEERNYYLFLIALLGIAIGTRNILSTVTLT